MGKYRERMGRSLGLEILLENGNKIDETYHVASCCGRFKICTRSVHFLANFQT